MKYPVSTFDGVILLFRSKIVVTLRKSILDPQGKAVEHGIHALGFSTVKNVRMGKYIELEVETERREDAERAVTDVSKKLLANPVMEDYSFTVEEIEQVQQNSAPHV